ncbi:methyltransferase [Flaviaesturariibacter amylovorans]|uniref:Methyltransferase small domain-containing protein n=1 Tax=Flaviaesturariibacter amylovorans TaxID=1084520 RepID=A0ABP8HEE7_9BACT
MKSLVKYLVSITVKPVLVKYLSGTRTYRYRNIVLQVPPEVFHPGFFTSTRMLLRYLQRTPLKGRSFLELGAGSGLLAVYAAQQGAVVTASDINPASVEILSGNARQNGVSLRVLHSDLFDAFPAGAFDVVAINPPYYRRQPASPKEQAWYCGAEGEYFQRLFTQLRGFLHADSDVLMVLCSGCDLAMIGAHAAAGGFVLQLVQRRQGILEDHFIYRIETA